MSKAGWFRKDVKGLNADIDRHRAKEAELDAKIAELEGSKNLIDIAALEVYHELRAKLLESKAEVVSKIGKENV